LLPRDEKTKRVLYDFRQAKTLLFLGITLVLLTFYTLRTISRNPVWKDNFTLFSHDVKYGDKSALLLKHYGSELINQSVSAEDPEVKDSLMKAGMAEVQKAIDINPRFSEAYFKMGYAYYQLHDFKTSIENYKKANPNNSMTMSNMALAYYMDGDYAEALKLLKKSLQLDPYNATARQNMPLVQGAFDRKMQTMQTQQSTNPQHYFELGNLLAEQQKYAEAMQNFNRALALNPKYLGALLNKGNCQYMLKDYESAITTFKEVLNQSPNHPQAIKNLSHIYGLLGNSEMQEFYDRKIQGGK
jgi:tetratricopeptide (TPR) repeat protein